jgi:hypothetical protein
MNSEPEWDDVLLYVDASQLLRALVFLMRRSVSSARHSVTLQIGPNWIQAGDYAVRGRSAVGRDDDEDDCGGEEPD